MTSRAAVVNGPYTRPVADGTEVKRNRLLKLDSSGNAVYAGTSGDAVVGVSDNDMSANAADRVRGNSITVVPLNHEGQLRMTASAAIGVGVELGIAADGKVAAGTGLGFVNISDGISTDGHVLTAVPITKIP